MLMTRLPSVVAVMVTVAATAAGAAESVAVRRVDGAPALVVDGRPVPPHMFLNATWDTELVADSLAQAFVKADVHLHQFDVNLDWADDFDGIDDATAARRYRGADERLRALARIDPAVLVLLRVHLWPREAWAATHPDEILTYQDGTRIFHSKWAACHSYASKVWRDEAGRRLVALVRHLQKTGLERHVLGYLLFVGWSGEWNFFRQSKQGLSEGRYGELANMAVDHSPAMIGAFRSFLRGKYGTDAAWRRAWRTDAVALQTAVPPTEQQVRTALPRQLNSPRACAIAADYFACNAKEVADSLLHFARLARRAAPTRINGAFFGEFLFTHIGGNRVPQRNGHGDVDRVLASPDIDFICSPNAYQARKVGQHSPSMCLVDSARRHGKLVWYEFDQPTHLAPAKPDRAPVPNRDVPADLAESRALMRRAFGYALVKDLGLWWWDQAGRWGNAVEGGVWYRGEAVRAEFALYQKIWAQALADRRRVLPPTEIAVIYDPRSCFFQQSSWRDLSYDLIYRQLDALGKMGAPYDTFSLADADGIAGYKLYVVWNAFYLTRARADAITRLTHRPGVTTLWFYAPGYLSPDGVSPLRPGELTGLSVRETEGVPTGRMTALAALGAGRPFGRDTGLAPTFRVDGGEPLAVYEGTDIPAAGVVERQGWRSFYFASAPLPARVLRHIVKAAGCHQYVTNDDVVYVGARHVVLHTAEAGTHTIRLPRALSVRDAVTGKLVATDRERINLTCREPTTWILEVAP